MTKTMIKKSLRAYITRRQFENMVLLNGKVFRIAHSQPLKEFIKYGSVFFIVLSYFCGVYHFHYH